MSEGDDTHPSRSASKVSEVDKSPSAIIAAAKDIEIDPSFHGATAPSWVLGFMVVVSLISGSTNSLVQKWMNKQQGPPCVDCEIRYFEAPNFFTFLMWVGEFICMFVWLGDVWYSKRVGRVPPTDMVTNAVSYAKPHCPIYLWILPCVFDYAASTCINYAYMWGQASTVQLLRNFNVIITAGISIMYLRVALRRRHWIGTAVISLGLVLTGMYSLINPDEESNDAKPVLGLILSLVGTAINGFQVIFQESLFRKYYASPFEGVGWMGLFGIMISVVVLILCETLGWEDVSGNFYMIGNSWQLLLGVFIYICNVCLFNAGALAISKLGTGVMWQVVKASRSVITWILELAIGWTTFMWLSFSGMVCVTLGSLYYNAILWPNKWTPSFWEWNHVPVITCGCNCLHLKSPDAPRVPLVDKFADERSDENVAQPDSSAKELV